MLYVNSEKVPINCNVSDFDIEQSAIDLDLDSGMYFPDPSNFVAVMYIEGFRLDKQWCRCLFL
jgi:hypothetical protein